MRAILISIIVWSFCVVSATAQQIDQMPVITVTGTAEILVAPDEAVFSLDVTKVNKDLQAAKRLNDETVGKVLELTRRYSVAAQDVKTDQISVDMKYEQVRNPGARVYDEDGDEIGRRVFIGYEVSKTVIVRLRDLSQFEKFFAEVLESGITEVNSVRFETSKLIETRVKARDMAMKAAREKAAAMTASIGQSIGKAVSITEGNTAPRYSAGVLSNTIATSGTFSDSVATFAPGAIRVEVQVTVSFLLN